MLGDGKVMTLLAGKTEIMSFMEGKTEIMSFMAGNMGIMLLLVFNSWKDIRKKEVSLWTILMFAVIGVIRSACVEGINVRRLAAIGIGGMVVVLSVLSKGEVGMGDGLLLMAMGTVLSAKQLLGTLLIGLFCCCIWGLILLFLPKTGRKTEIPFVPFLLLGYVGGLIY